MKYAAHLHVILLETHQCKKADFLINISPQIHTSAIKMLI